MRIRVLSDLHTEHMGEGWRDFVDAIPTDADVLVLAGDIATTKLEVVLRRFAERWHHVLFVAGNHEFYGASVGWTSVRLGQIALDASLANVSVLEDTVAVVDGRRFLGCTLWFPEPFDDRTIRAKELMTDFHVIRGFEPWVYRKNAASLAFLDSRMQPGDVVITHHLPTSRSTPARFENSGLNPFFVGSPTVELMEGVMEERLLITISQEQPALWIHGHTHDSVDYRIGAARVVCNPYGYHGREVNPSFDPSFTVEV